MALDDHALKVVDSGGNRLVITGRDRAAIEKASAVIALDVAGWGPCRQRMVNLRGNCAGGRVTGKCIAPKVAHEATPRALAVRQKDGCHAHDLAGCGALVFDGIRIRSPRIEKSAIWTMGEYPFISLQIGYRIDG